MTEECDPRLTLDINSDILHAVCNDESLRDIPKIFLFDCSSYPPKYREAVKGNFYTCLIILEKKELILSSIYDIEHIICYSIKFIHFSL